MAAQRLIRDVGHIRAFAVLAAACSIISLVFGATQNVAVWFALRLVMGFCQAGLFTVVEGWLSAATPARSRGGVLSFYLVATRSRSSAASSSWAASGPTRSPGSMSPAPCSRFR